jgi:hypothetical protein
MKIMSVIPERGGVRSISRSTHDVPPAAAGPAATAAFRKSLIINRKS